jgi:predicted MFS family arabinose efflux permease
MEAMGITSGRNQHFYAQASVMTLPVDPARYLAFLGVMAVMAVTPGPANLFSIATGAQRGKGAALVGVAGMNSATLVWFAAAALGLGALILAFPQVFHLLAFGGFGHLLLSRIGMASGLAGCMPPANSLIADIAPKAKIATAFGIIGLAIPVGSFLAKSFGGVLCDAYGWRATLGLAAAPALVLLPCLLALRDPRRAIKTAPAPGGSGLGQAARELLRSRSLICLTLGGLVMSALVAGNSFWGMMHFQRTLGLSPGQAGLLLGVQGGVTGVVGALGGGWLADRMSGKDMARCLTPAVIGMSLTPLFLIPAWWASDWRLAIVLLTLPTMFDNLCYGGVAAVTQRLLSPHVRGAARRRRSPALSALSWDQALESPSWV